MADGRKTDAGDKPPLPASGSAARSEDAAAGTSANAAFGVIAEGRLPRAIAQHVAANPAGLAGLASSLGNHGFGALVAGAAPSKPQIARAPAEGAGAASGAAGETAEGSATLAGKIDALIVRVRATLLSAEAVLGEEAGSNQDVARTRQLIEQLESVRASGDEDLMRRTLQAFTPEGAQAAGAPTEVIGSSDSPLLARSMSTPRGPQLARAAAVLAPAVAAGPVGWAIIGVVAVGALIVLMSSQGRPRRNVDQNRQFADAVREIERRLGRRLTRDELRRLHEELQHYGDPGYHDIVEIGIGLFGGA